jgi:hypothetical protein
MKIPQRSPRCGRNPKPLPEKQPDPLLMGDRTQIIWGCQIGFFGSTAFLTVFNLTTFDELYRFFFLF